MLTCNDCKRNYDGSCEENEYFRIFRDQEVVNQVSQATGLPSFLLEHSAADFRQTGVTDVSEACPHFLLKED